MKSKEDLALFGGPRVLEHPPIEHWRKIDGNVRNAVLNLMDQNLSTIPNGGGVVAEFESAFAKMTGSRYALAMNSGTSTLHSAYAAVGVGPGDEVLVPAYTWHATITPILHCSATPVFCDIDPATLTICPDDLERKITPRTKAISIVHVWGNVCDMDRILEIAKRHRLPLIEDCSHAHGAAWNGRKVGSMGAIGCFSCQGPKAVSGGELGIAVTDDAELYDRMILLGHFGRAKVGCNEAIRSVGDMSLGSKYRAHAWAVAMANEDLKRLPELNAKRTRNYQILNDGLRNTPGIEVINPLPGAERGGYLEFKWKLTPEALSIASRDRITEAIQAEGVPLMADRYSNTNYTYGLLHTAPLFTTFDLRSIGGGYYDPASAPGPRHPVKLPNSEGMVGRLVGTEAFIDVEPEIVAAMAEGICKAMDRIELLG
jgi:perosamine synthetase